jgi:hypothetical protein
VNHHSTRRSAALLGALCCMQAAGAAGAPTTRYELVPVAKDASAVTWLPARKGSYRAPQPSAGLRWLAKPSRGRELQPADPGHEYAELGFQAIEAGHFEVELDGLLLSVDAVEVRALDARGREVDPRTSHASLSRSLPAELGSIPGEDEDALRFLVIAPLGLDVPGLQVLSTGPRAEALDALPRLPAPPATCPDGVSPELVCRETLAMRAVGDALDRNQGSVRGRSLRALVGGSLRLALAGRPLLELKVGGPRNTRFGPIERLRAKLRVLVLRQRPGGPPALGGSDTAARQVMTRELAAAAALWGQCGIELGAPGQPSIDVVDPPVAQLLTIGCGVGQPASGGELRFRVGKRPVRLATRAGESPNGVALRLADALAAVGVTRVKTFDNQRAAGDALPTADLLLEGAGKLEPEAELPTSSDATLPLCSSGLDLSDGLTHFGDIDAFVGTVEERVLLRGFDDGDASTIEVLVVPSFARSERIGESFIQGPGSSLSSAVIIDRQAIFAGARSFALAHELGHVFLAMPGHPDDFGVDQSWSLMDADVADPTIFGPRRLSVSDCERALVQSGPDALVPLLERVRLH